MTQKSAIIAIIGKPNAGKSTLLNRLIGARISIVTHKVQTTRNIIRGIVTDDDCQYIYIDTPGIFEPKKNLEKNMVKAAWASINGADFVAIIVDSRYQLDNVQRTILSRVQQNNSNLIILLNKLDLESKNIKILEQEIKELVPNATFFKISATNGDGVENFTKYIALNSKEAGWNYTEEDITDLPIRFLAAELTREQLFLQLNEELPYNLMVETEGWEENPDGSIKINQVIIVSRQAHKKIVLGKSGAMIKDVGIKARQAILDHLEIKAHLFLFVKVREDWERRACQSL